MIRFMVMEKLNQEDGIKIDDFRFTPGPNWMEVPIVDMVNTLIKSSSKIKDFEVVNLID